MKGPSSLGSGRPDDAARKRLAERWASKEADRQRLVEQLAAPAWTCGFCGRTFRLLSNGRLPLHGPVGARCLGSP